MQHATAKSIDGKLKSGHFIYADFIKLNDSGEKEEEHILKNLLKNLGNKFFLNFFRKK